MTDTTTMSDSDFGGVELTTKNDKEELFADKSASNRNTPQKQASLKRNPYVDNTMLLNEDNHGSDNSLEKMRIRLAAESYKDKTGNYDTVESDTESDSPPRNPESRALTCCRVVTPVVILLTVCITVVIAFAMLSVILKIKLDAASHACLTPDCVINAGLMLDKMNITANKCEDFYEYACGQFNRDELRPPDKAAWDAFVATSQRTTGLVKQLLDTPGSEYKGYNSSAIDKAKRFYAACLNISAIDTLGAEPLLTLIKSLGSWPLSTDQQWNAALWNLDQAMTAVQSFGSSALFGFEVGMDMMNSSRNILEIDQSGLTFSSNKVYSGGDAETYHHAFVTYFSEIASLLGGNSADIATYAEKVWQLEKVLASAFVSAEDRTDIRKLYNIKTIADLQNIFDGDQIISSQATLDFKLLLQTTLGHPLLPTEQINIAVPSYFQKLGVIVRSANQDTLATYLIWTAVRSMIRYMPSNFQIARLNFFAVLTGVSVAPAQWERCVSETESVLGFATGALYVQKYFTETDRNSVKSIAQEIVQEFSKQLISMSWMDQETRARAKDKAQSITTKIGYPEFIQDVKLLDKYYEKLTVTDSAFTNALNCFKFSIQENADKYGKPPDTSEWHDMPSEVNAYYSATTNQMVLPAGILQKPFYDKTFPKSLVFGAIGFVIGHELTHGFDNTGRRFDKHGNMIDWWGSGSSQQYMNKSQCFVDEYSNFSVNGHQLNGVITLGENIADNGGLRISFSAYKNWVQQRIGMMGNLEDQLLPGLNMTTYQQFYLSFAQVWCGSSTDQHVIQSILTNPHTHKKYRVNGSIRNAADFAKNFKCSKSDALNPIERCTLF